jgi:hypothetical protein
MYCHGGWTGCILLWWGSKIMSRWDKSWHRSRWGSCWDSSDIWLNASSIPISMWDSLPNYRCCNGRIGRNSIYSWPYMIRLDTHRPRNRGCNTGKRRRCGLHRFSDQWTARTHRSRFSRDYYFSSCKVCNKLPYKCRPKSKYHYSAKHIRSDMMCRL